MRKSIILVIMLVNSAFVCAEQDYSQYIFKAPKSEVMEIEEKGALDNPDLVRKATVRSFQELNSYWVHEIAAVEEGGTHLTLKDKTVWHIGWWWQSKVQGWNPGDKVSLTYNSNSSYNYVEFYNATQNQTAWGNLYDLPKKSDSLVTSVTSLENYFYTVLLNNGLRLHANISEGLIPMFTYWREGDIVVTVSVSGITNPHALWNLTRYHIVINLQIDP